MLHEPMRRLVAANPVATAPAVPDLAALIDGWAADGLIDDVQAAPVLAAPSSRRRQRLRSTGLSIALAALVGTGSAAAALAALTGSPIPGRADTVTVRPEAGTTRLSAVRAADPDGGPPWALRLGSAPGALQCLGVGQVQAGALGLVGLDGRFRPVEPAGADDCGVAPAPNRFTAQARTFLGTTSARAVTVIYGVRGSGLRSVRVRYLDSMTKVLPVAPDGGFVIARRGALEDLQPRLELVERGGQTQVVEFAITGRRTAYVDPGPPFDPSAPPGDPVPRPGAHR